MKSSISFSRTKLDFSATLNKRVNEYFRVNNISRTGNSEMVIKTIFMFLLYFVPYALIISNTVTSPLLLIAMTVLMSIGVSGIGLSVMHDANHGAYAKKVWVNNLIGYSLNLIGANSFNWKMQHNVMHHTYTNVHEEDEDIVSRGVLRLTPHSEWKYIYKFQHVYAWFLYGLLTIMWMLVRDFGRLIKYQRNGLAKKHKASMGKEWVIMIVTKLVYIGYIFVLPLLLTDLSWWQILLGILTMHYIAGFMLAIIFQPAHVIEGTEFPLPDDDRVLENNWAIHQLLTTTNFGNRSKWFSWYVGGLNFQIEHHLFPNICHVHYRKIADIVKATALEFDLPYKSSTTFLKALQSHARLLKELGKRPVTSIQ
ncbi:MAG: acyl-CoA desaturase [Azospira oryzae]|nr:MAG: acyl-CoA desaturase [Azospira oryzae]